MGDLRIFLRYGIVGYMVIFFDLIFICSLIGYPKYLIYLKEWQLGAIVVVLGLPVGWVCYQIWDWYLNRKLLGDRLGIKLIQKWQEEVIEIINPNNSFKAKYLKTEALKVIANIYLRINIIINESGNQEIVQDPRGTLYGVYSNNCQARGVVYFALPIITLVSYLIIFLYRILTNMHAYIFSEIDLWLLIISIILPSLVSLVAWCDFDRVKREDQLMSWTILLEKKFYIKNCLERYLTDDMLKDYFRS